MHYLLNGTVLKGYENTQHLQSLRLLRDYVDRPTQWCLHHFRYAHSSIHRLISGEQMCQTQQQLHDFQRINVQYVTSINASLIDFFPILAKIPTILQPWRHHWESMGQAHFKVLRAWWTQIKRQILTGIASPSLIRDVVLRSSTKFETNDEEAMYLATSIVAAGSDNVRMSVNIFVLAAICFAETKHQASDQIDRICEAQAERLP